VNLNGPFYFLYHLGRRMREQDGGRAVNVSSQAALAPSFGRASYTATKLGLEGLTQALGHDLAGRVAVNCLRIDVPVYSEGFDETLDLSVLSTMAARAARAFPLLRDARVPPSLQTRAEGLGELGMGAAAAVGGGGAGPLLATGGFALLGLVAAAPCLLLFLALVGHATRRRWSAADGRLQSRHRRTLSR